MEVVAAASNGVPPFHDHDVREWSRIDSLTGVLERARLETDHWTANTSNQRHQYGKVVDSRARTDADGALQQQARRQLEVFHSQIPGGHLQVIKTQTVSSSRWSHNNSKHFENLQLTLNPLDLTSEKSKANVGRTFGRRPPSRPRPKDEPSSSSLAPTFRVARLCHQIHEKHLQEARQDPDGVEIHQLESTSSPGRSLSRKKSTSSEELDKSTKSGEDLEDLEELQNWRRSSKLRRSLQYPNKNQTPPKPIDLPENSVSVRKIREELEKGRRLNTALRGNQVDLEALDQILKSISNSSIEEPPDDDDMKKQKRNSFVTVESLQEVKGRLRPTKDEEDDGIVTEETNEVGKVRSYVYGMEKKPMVGTGSLESRTKLTNGTTNNLRNEDWYNRRKSYGFEQVHNQSDALKKRVESSTDSGIYRSSDIVPSGASVKEISSIFDQKVAKATTITIPIHSWDDDNIPEKENKRHSIAVDESKYVTNGTDLNNYRRTSLVVNPIDRKGKKVEFCKTEVHFGEGRVNIVETDEKPPPTHNFRRRRRNSGPIDEVAYDRNLPVLHFGDSSYEKELLGLDDDSGNIPFGVVTVNTNFKSYQNEGAEDEKKETLESVKGILKNKPIKPIPYHLGEEPYLNGGSDSDSGKWGVKLKPVQAPDPPFWKSTVILHNPVFKEQEPEPEFQKLLKKLRPVSGTATKPDLLNRRSWCDETQWAENKVYSTRVNFGDGGTTVVQNNDFDATKDRIWAKQSEQKDADRVTTTTKITIDLSPSPTESKTPPLLVPNNGTTKRSHSFKSTSLILDTINKKENCNSRVQGARIPHQLEALKKLYEDVHSDDSDADKEVQSLMGRMVEKEEVSSELSGSWSRMTAFRAVNECINHKTTRIGKGTDLQKPEVKFSPVSIPKTEVNHKLNSPSLVTRSTDVQLHQKHDKVLRQPKKSEMTYFGVNIKPKKPVITQPVSTLTEKPDLLQHMKPAPMVPPPQEQPIYENLNRKPRDFDAKILEELTKAADQILQAVNGFSDDDEDDEVLPEPLDTITESKSWSQSSKTTKTITQNSKLKATSSNSSIETKKQFRKPVHTSTPIRKAPECATKSSVTKARRLQRASSREALLLQSHGSSSEDLANVKVVPPQRKPRQVRKTKTMQLTVTNGLEVNNKKEAPKRIKPEPTKKTETRRAEPVEIRHKTAVSTIRSTAEKTSRERSTTRPGDEKKRIKNQRESTRGLVSSLSSRPESKKSSIGSREVSNHRIATANIKKCHRAEGGGRQ